MQQAEEAIVSEKVTAVGGDITTQQVDAIVNAANASLLGGGGVDGAIHAAAGPSVLTECRRIRAERYPEGLPVSEAVATGAGELPARWVIHTVGPNAHRGETDPALLAACFTNSLAEAVRIGARSLAIPAVSAGVYGWDAEQVAQIAVGAAGDFLAGDQGSEIDQIRFVLFSEPILLAFERALIGRASRGADSR